MCDSSWKCLFPAADDGLEFLPSELIGDNARVDKVPSLSIRAFSILRLTFRLCKVSGDISWSKTVRARGLGRLGRFWLDEGRRKSPRPLARDVGEYGREGIRTGGLLWGACSSSKLICFWREWITLSLSKTVFSKARIWDVAAESSRACCWRIEPIISSSNDRGILLLVGELTASLRDVISSSRAASSFRKVSISFCARSKNSCSSSYMTNS